MADRRQRKSAEVEVVEEATVTEAPPSEHPEDVKALEYVTREEHDRAVRSLRDDISALKEHLDDLNNVVTAPAGSVRFLDIDPQQDSLPVPPEDQGDAVPWYQPGYQG